MKTENMTDDKVGPDLRSNNKDVATPAISEEMSEAASRAALELINLSKGKEYSSLFSALNLLTTKTIEVNSTVIPNGNPDLLICAVAMNGKKPRLMPELAKLVSICVKAETLHEGLKGPPPKYDQIIDVAFSRLEKEKGTSFSHRALWANYAKSVLASTCQAATSISNREPTPEIEKCRNEEFQKVIFAAKAIKGRFVLSPVPEDENLHNQFCVMPEGYVPSKDRHGSPRSEIVLTLPSPRYLRNIDTSSLNPAQASLVECAKAHVAIAERSSEITLNRPCAISTFFSTIEMPLRIHILDPNHPDNVAKVKALREELGTAYRPPSNASDESRRKDEANLRRGDRLSLGAHIDKRANGTAMLFDAVKNGQTALVRELLTEGIDPNVVDPNERFIGGWTALHEAVMRGDASIVRLLRDAGAKSDARTFSEAINPKRDILAVTPQELAESAKFTDVVNALKSAHPSRRRVQSDKHNGVEGKDMDRPTLRKTSYATPNATSTLLCQDLDETLLGDMQPTPGSKNAPEKDLRQVPKSRS